MDSINFLLISVTLLSSFLGCVLIFHGNSNKVSTAYALNVVAILCWMTSMYFFRSADTIALHYFWVTLLYIAATLIASSFLFFTHYFPKVESRLNPFTKALQIFIPNIILIYFLVSGNTIIDSVVANPSSETTIYFGKAYVLYVLYILAYFMFGFFRLLMKYGRTTDKTEGNQIKFLLGGYMVASTIAFASNLFLPWFGVFTLNWLGQVAGVIMVASSTYAIFRYKLFNVRIVTTEIMTFSLWASILIRTLLSTTLYDQVANLILFVITLVFGTFLIRSVIKEVRQREEIQKLAVDLEQANEQLRVLDQMKSEFISFATHQIRAPLTAIKGYSSLLLEEDYGILPKSIHDVVKIIFNSCENLVVIVNEFLDMSRIEQGRMKYEKMKFELLGLVKETIEQLLPNVEQAGLGLEFHHAIKETYNIYADKNKMKQVISNLIDNAIKYTPKGGITVSLSKHNGKVLFSLKDTGVGIDPLEAKKLFFKFTRAKDANKINVTGTGLGLYVAKQMVEAMGGQIWVDSEGNGKGSTFNVEMLEVINENAVLPLPSSGTIIEHGTTRSVGAGI